MQFIMITTFAHEIHENKMKNYIILTIHNISWYMPMVTV